MSCESASFCEKFDVYIGNFVGNNAKGKIKNAVLNKFKLLYGVGQHYCEMFIIYVVDYTCVY